MFYYCRTYYKAHETRLECRISKCRIDWALYSEKKVKQAKVRSPLHKKVQGTWEARVWQRGDGFPEAAGRASPVHSTEIRNFCLALRKTTADP